MDKETFEKWKDTRRLGKQICIYEKIFGIYSLPCTPIWMDAECMECFAEYRGEIENVG